MGHPSRQNRLANATAIVRRPCLTAWRPPPGTTGPGKGPSGALDKVNLKIRKGGVILNGKEVVEPGPERAVVFQHHSLPPWLSAYENIELGVKQVFKGKKSKAEMREWIEYNVDSVPKTKIEVAVDESQVEPVIETINSVARTGKSGDGKVFVYELTG